MKNLEQLYNATYRFLYDNYLTSKLPSLDDMEKAVYSDKNLKEFCKAREDILISDREITAYYIASKIVENLKN